MIMHNCTVKSTYFAKKNGKKNCVFVVEIKTKLEAEDNFMTLEMTAD